MTALAEPWARAYRPLRARTLLAQLVLLVVVEVLLFHSYRDHEADFHWAAHFLVGLSAAALFNLVWLAIKGAPARGLLISILLGHLFAMAPDLIFNAGVAHAPWMNLFLGHIWVHYIPGGNTTLLGIALLASGAYAGCLTGWLQARTIEADAGLAPGIGIGGGALIAAQRSPRTTPLAHVHYGPERPPDLLLLHGLAASHEVWEPVAHELASRTLSVIVPDLLGFGGSRRIGTSFHLDDHVDGLQRLLDENQVEQTVVVGHSFGCAVAAALAHAEPERVDALVLVSPPVFRDAAKMRARLGERGWLARQVIAGSPVASFSCNLMCLTRPAMARLIPRLARDVPRVLARDSVQHTWPAYRDALEALLRDNPLPAVIIRPPRPTTVVLGETDNETPAGDVLDHPHEAVEVVVLAGDHLLPFNAPAEVAAVIAHAHARARGSRGAG